MAGRRGGTILRAGRRTRAACDTHRHNGSHTAALREPCGPAGLTLSQRRPCGPDRGAAADRFQRRSVADRKAAWELRRTALPVTAIVCRSWPCK